MQGYNQPSFPTGPMWPAQYPGMGTAVVDFASPRPWFIRMSFPAFNQLSGRSLLVHEIHSSFGSDMITLHPGPWWARKGVHSMDPQPMAVLKEC